MNDDVAIKVTNVSKSFVLPHDKQNSIKGGLISMVKSGKRTYEKQEVLKDVSFEIKKGEFFGIVGRNGSGKSTLLKMLAGIYTPTSGSVQVNGSLTPFIELGVGFNPELTGRENVYLNGALLGFNRKQMEAMYDEIVEFAELERFMDQRLKNYSSGMQVRLAFSIAIQAKSDILILDEVLAVGDEAFQRKCIGVFEKYKAKNQTIILVTHDMNIVERFCTKAVMIENGVLTLSGSPSVVSRRYSALNSESYSKNKNSSTDDKGILTVSLRDGITQYDCNAPITVDIAWKDESAEDVGITVMKQSGEYMFGANTSLDSYRLPRGAKTISLEIKLNLTPGDYYIKAGLFKDRMATIIDFIDEGPSFIINDDKLTWGGLTHLEHAWSHKKD